MILYPFQFIALECHANFWHADSRGGLQILAWRPLASHQRPRQSFSERRVGPLTYCIGR